MANTKISELTTWTGTTTGFYLVVDNSGLTQTYKVTKETLGIFAPEILQKSSTVDQTVAVGNNVSFDSTDFNLNITASSNTTTTLKAGRTYQLRASLRLSAGSGTGSELNFRWWNNTSSAYVGITGGVISTDASWSGQNVNEALGYITVGASDVSIQLKITASSNTPIISTNQSRMSIMRVG